MLVTRTVIIISWESSEAKQAVTNKLSESLEYKEQVTNKLMGIKGLKERSPTNLQIF